MSTFPDDLVAEIEQSGPSIHEPDTGGLPARPAGIGHEEPHAPAEDPSRYLDLGDGPSTPPLAPHQQRRSTGGIGGQYVHNDMLSAAHYAIADAHRRPRFHEIATPAPLAEAWQKVLETKAEADAAMQAIPHTMAKTAADRAAALTDAEEPVVLPSVADARAFAEQLALRKISICRAARARYDELVVQVRDEHAALLAASVPDEAKAIVDAVAGLRERVQRLRDGVAAVVEVAAAGNPNVVSRSTGREVDLAVLDELEGELARLADRAANPVEPACTPSVSERRLIAREMHQAVGLTPAVINLARIERSENFKHTAHTKGIPHSVLQNAAQNAAAMGTYY